MMDAAQSKLINEEIKKRYTKEDTKKLAEELGISVYNLQKRASRMQIRKGTVANAIIDGKKLCCICGKFKKLTEYRKDSYQPNGLDYRCKECRKMIDTGEIENIPAIVLKNGKWAFNRRRTKNPVINGKIKCRGFCKQWKYLNEFDIDRKMSHGHVNYCKQCKHKLYEINKRYEFNTEEE